MKQCKNCKYSMKLVTVDAYEELLVDYTLLSPMLECRRYPPKGIVYKNNYLTRFPLVLETTHACGEFKKKWGL